MIKWRTLAITAIVLISLAGLALSQRLSAVPYYLSNDSTSVISAMAGKPITSVDLLPDTVPEYLPRSATQKFDNKKFHVFEVSPNGKYAAFSAGEGDQWMGVMCPEERYMKFLLYSIKTNFFGVHWSPDSKYLAFAYLTPDHRYVVQIIRPPEKEEKKYEAMNAWQIMRLHGEQVSVTDWTVANGDTTFGIIVADSLGTKQKTIDLPLRRGQTPPQQPAGEN